MNLAPALRQRFFDNSGLPLAGGLLYSYAAGTTTPQVTYSNSTGTTNANPVVLDANGYADVWMDPSLTYKFILKDSGGATLWSVDNATTTSLGIAAWSANLSYSAGSIVQDASGQGLLYVSLTNSNQGNALTNVAAWRMFGGNIRTVSVNTSLAVTDELVQSNSTSGNLIQTLPACSTTPIGKRIAVKDVGTSTNYTQVKGSGSDNVEGTNTFGVNLTSGLSYVFENTGSAWVCICGNAPSAGTVATGMIAAQAVTSAKIANGAVGSTQIAAGGVAASNLAAPIGSQQTFTSSGSYTVPAGATLLSVVACGGGGGGGGGAGGDGASAVGEGGSGGQGAPILRVDAPAAAGVVLTVTIGGGGSGGGAGSVGAQGGGVGSAGASSTVVGTGVSITALGGVGGKYGLSSIPGSVGSPGTQGGNSVGAGGVGGAGGTGSGLTAGTNGGGGGGGAGGNAAAAGQAGAAGGSGYVKITVIG